MTEHGEHPLFIDQRPGERLLFHNKQTHPTRYVVELSDGTKLSLILQPGHSFEFIAGQTQATITLEGIGNTEDA